jgi:hypothetical protein
MADTTGTSSQPCCNGGLPQNSAQGTGMGCALDPHIYGMGVLLTNTHAQATKHHKKKKK